MDVSIAINVSCGRSRDMLRHMDVDHALSPSCYRISQVKFVLIRLLAVNKDSFWELLITLLLSSIIVIHSCI
jgi:hypothetical protein